MPLDKYLQHYAEPEARQLLEYSTPHTWHQVLVIPAYREPADFAMQLRQLAQRITTRYQLKPLNVEETDRYIRHRLHIAGLREGQTLFSAAAVKRLHKISAGLPCLAMTLAIVNVLPLPVTPISTCSFCLAFNPFTKDSIAAG